MPAPSEQDFQDAARAVLVLSRPDIIPDEGTVVDFLLAAVAASGDYNAGRAAALQAELFLDTASGQALTTLADDRYAIQRFPSTKAVGQTVLSRPLPGIATPGSVPIGSIVATDFNTLGERIEFETTTEAVYGDFTTSVFVQLQAKVAGSAGNVAAGKIFRIVSTLFDSTILTSNALRMAGGGEEETDAALKERVRTFPTTIRRATIAALEYGARTVPGVVSAKVFEGDTGLVTVYVADGTGFSNAQLNAAVQLELVNWRAAGVVVQVVSAEPLVTDFTFSVKAKPGFDVAASTTLIQGAVTSRLAKLTMGEVCYLDEIKAAIFALAPDLIQRVTFTAPLADVTPLAYQKVTPGAVSVSVEP